MRKFNTRLFAGLLAVFCCMTTLSATAYADGGYYEQSEDGSETPPSSIDSITISTESVKLPEQQGSEALTPDGNLTLIDDILQSAPYASVEEAAENKQFITVQSKNGNYFYIVIDRSGDTENVYFLNLVDEADLMALMEDSGSAAAWTEEVLSVTITPRTPDDMRVFYQFTAEQDQALDALLDNSELLASLAGDLTISSQAAKDLLAALPADLAPERRAVVQTACQLVGKVRYFWGGKSLKIGWDDRWGTLRQVTAAGSSTTGTYRPFGMDCSGFADWVFYNTSGGEYVIGHGGGAHAQHTYCTPISWEEALPGDLVFYPGDEHVGIVGGRDEAGDLLIVHCASNANNVVITGKSGFTSIGRPVYYRE